MSEPDFADEDLFAPVESDDFINKRKGVRYIRKDITASITIRRYFTANEILVRLHDISSRGALIACNAKLKPKQRLSLTLTFSSGRKFRIPSIITHIETTHEQSFGLKFESLNNNLGNYLLKTQTDLIVK
jgi:PilZ domain-containing protein